jgi:DNA-binding transcriptional LysR family regulator
MVDEKPNNEKLLGGIGIMPFRNGLAKLDFQLLLALDALLRQRHLTRASDELGVSQPAMSKYLRRLRTLLGDPLFFRVGTAMVPTQRAAALAEPLAQILDLAARGLFSSVDFDPRRSDRTFSLLTSDFGAAVVLAPLSTELERLAPRIRLRILNVDEQSNARLERGDADLLIGVVQRLSEAVSTRVLYEDGFTCLIRKDHRLTQRPWTLDAFRDARHVVVSLESGRSSALERAIALHAPDAHVAVRLPAFAAVPSLIASTDLVVTIPKRVAAVVARTTECVELPVPFPVPPLTIILAWHRRNDDEPAHRWLRATVERALVATPLKR